MEFQAVPRLFSIPWIVRERSETQIISCIYGYVAADKNQIYACTPEYMY